MSVRFLHAADLHLGLRLTRFETVAAAQIAEARYQALDNLKRMAIESRADFVILAGDVFDDNNVPHQVSERTFAILEGSSWPGPVFVIPGNHDPLVPGSIWHRDPWQRDQPHQRVRLLRTAEPVALPEFGVTLYPCPVRHAKSIDDPTQWIAAHPRRGDDGVRIGVAHGSLRILPQLPEDDHLIAADAADQLDLDYLALGHWHKPLRHGVRTAYPGTHEPFRFAEESAADSAGWVPYASDGSADRFADNGRGIAYRVEIDSPGAVPRIEELPISHLAWQAERVNVTGRSPGQLLREYSSRPDPQNTLLRLRLEGVLGPQEHRRLGELHEVIVGRYRAGSTCDSTAVLIQPSEEELRTAVGPGVLARVLQRLQGDLHADAAETRALTTLALRHLYQLVWEDRPK